MKIELEHVLPADIERRSFAIISQELGPRTYGGPYEEGILKRVIHTSADFDYSENLKFSSGAVEKAMKEQAGEDPLRREGYRDGTWVLLDYGCVVVHVFSAEAREFYSLERLWHDGKPVDLSGVLTEN